MRRQISHGKKAERPKEDGLSRAEFLRAAFCSSAVVCLPRVNAESGVAEFVAADKSHNEDNESHSLIASSPVLQNAAETSIGVAFAVSGLASGWVDLSLSPQMTNAKRYYSGEGGIMDINDKIALVRIRNLKPSTRYYYRIGANRINYQDCYNIQNLGPEVDNKVHSFRTLGPGLDGSFCVINDTHEAKDALGRVYAKLAELKPSVVIWNGDASNDSETMERAMGVFIHPHSDYPEYASDTPYMFVNGNHDFRGLFNRHLKDLMMMRDASERSGRFASLGRNFVQRFGDVALIGLDTGEDKLDENPLMAGIFQMKEYRELQTQWLAEEIEKPAIKNARYKVVCCHIPLFDPRADANPGDLAPCDTAPSYQFDFAIWQRTCSEMWGPLFEKAGVDLVICGHQHKFRYDPPSETRMWAQIVGGGPYVSQDKADEFPTVVEGRVENGRLDVLVHDVANSQVVGSYSFS